MNYPFFVYGSLRNGMRNYRHLHNRTKLEVPAALYGADMYAVTSYPAIIPGGGVVKGELMYPKDEFYNEVLEDLDRLEWNGQMYERKLVFVTTDASLAPVGAWVYFWLRRTDGLDPVPGGDWVEYFNSKLWRD